MSGGDAESATNRPGYVDGVSDSVRELVDEFSSGMNPTDWLILALTLLSVATVGIWFVGWLGVALAVGAGLTVAIATIAEVKESVLAQTASGFLVFLTAIFVLGIVGVTLTLVGTSTMLGVVGGLGMYCLVLSVVGAVFVPFETGETNFSRPLGTTLSVGSGVVIVFVTESIPRSEDRETAFGLISNLLEFMYGLGVSPGPEHVTLTFFALTAVAAFSLSVAFGKMPVERLLPPGRNEYWKRRFDTASDYLFVFFGISAIAAVMVSIVTFLPVGGDVAHADNLRQLPLGGVVVAVLANTGIRLVLVSASVIGFVSILVVRWVRFFRGGFVRSLLFSRLPVGVGVLIGVLGGILLSGIGIREMLLSGASSFTPENVMVSFGELSSFGLANLTFVFALATLVFFLVLLETTRILFANRGNAGPTLASVGLFGFGIAAILTDVFLGGLLAASVGLFVWDVGEFSREIRETVPSGASASRVESVHAAGSCLVISLSAVVAYVLYRVVTPLVSPQEPEVAALGLVLLILLAFPLIYVLRKES